MTDIFLSLVNISVTATYLVVAIILVRLILKKAPKWVNCILWALVAIRLVCPFSLESVTSLLPDNDFLPYETVFSQNERPIGDVASHYIKNNPVDFSLGFEDGNVVFNEFSSPAHDFVNPLYLFTYIFSIIWVIGLIILLLYSIISYIKLYKKVSPSLLYRDNIYFCDNIDSPFIFGIIKPKIYIPSGVNETDLEYIISHEKAHIKRLDFLWKPIGFAILTVYWFNPAMWLAYILLCRDIEAACDERVIKNTDNQYKMGYSEALLSCSKSRKMISACPVAFGETSVKSRIKTVLHYRKPAFWVIIISLILCLGLCLGFLTTPATNVAEIIDENGYRITEQSKKEISLNIPVAEIDEDVYSEKGKNFGKNEIVVYETNTSNIYLENAIHRNGKICLIFKFSYNDIPKSGSVLTGYWKNSQGYPYTTGLTDSRVMVDDVVFDDPEAAYMYLNGPNDSFGSSSFGISVSKKAFDEAKEYVTISAFCSEITFIKQGMESEIALDADIFNNAVTLQPAKYVMTAKGYEEDIKNAPLFCIYEDRTCDKVTDDGLYGYLGQFTNKKMTYNNFTSRFVDAEWKNGYNVDFLNLNFKSAWEIYDENDYYLLLESSDNTMYLCCGAIKTDSKTATFNCVYKMKAIKTRVVLTYEDSKHVAKPTIELDYSTKTFRLSIPPDYYNFSGSFTENNGILTLTCENNDEDVNIVFVLEKTEKGYKFIAEQSHIIVSEYSSYPPPIIPDGAEFIVSVETTLIDEYFDQKYIFPKVYNLGEYERTSYKHYQNKSFIFCEDIYVLKVRYNPENYRTQKTAVENMYKYVDLTTFNRTYKYVEGVDFTPYNGTTFISNDYTFRLVDSEFYGLYGSPKEMFFVGTSDVRKELVFVLYYDQDMDTLFGETFDEHLQNVCPELYEYATYMRYSDIETITLTDENHSSTKTIEDSERIYEICTAIDSLKLTSNHTEKPTGEEYTLTMKTLFGEEINMSLSSGCVNFGNGHWFKADEKAYKKLEKLLIK